MRLTPAIVALLVYGCGPRVRRHGADERGRERDHLDERREQHDGPDHDRVHGGDGEHRRRPDHRRLDELRPPPDLPGIACDPWQDTCPEGQKCKPAALILGPWDAASCVPVAEPATPVGGACEAAEWDLTDTCERGAVCHGFLGEDEEGRRCHELCGGFWRRRRAPTPARSAFERRVRRCVPVPLRPRAPACPTGQRCQIAADRPRFACGPGGDQSLAGEPCASPGFCSEGTACVAAALVPGCAGELCCAPVCDLEGPDTCGAALPGTMCAPWPVSSPDFDDACLPAALGLCSAI
ncbi:hypothetical protein [Nannocystis pusilla]|uniref:hypothetical protein n=1 Tax=Nannocystis pusilla TaxID=889268 RepID=UPI003B79FC73